MTDKIISDEPTGSAEFTADELAVDSSGNDQRHEDTAKEDVEFVGEFASLREYFISQLEELVNPAVHWIFDAVDWRQIQRRMEGHRWRYVLEGGAVYRVGLPQEPGPMGPWIPTHGGAGHDAG